MIGSLYRGIDVVATQRSGQFKLSDWHDANFQPGHFDQHRMIALAGALQSSAVFLPALGIDDMKGAVTALETVLDDRMSTHNANSTVTPAPTRAIAIF
jgi:hypothetical protein